MNEWQKWNEIMIETDKWKWIDENENWNKLNLENVYKNDRVRKVAEI